MEHDRKSSFERIKENRAKLDACPRHDFGELPEIVFGLQLKCKRCEGLMDATRANDYARGYEAAGGNPDEIIANFRGGTHNEELVNCPVCNGVAGVDVSEGILEGPDWHDCDFCDATGKVERQKALAYLNKFAKNKEFGKLYEGEQIESVMSLISAKCGVCGKPIISDGLTGTTCDCAKK